VKTKTVNVVAGGSLALLIGMMAGCATAPTDIEFDASAVAKQGNELGVVSGDDAILIVAIGAVANGGGYDFRQIREDEAGFAASPVHLGFGSWGIGDKMQRPEDEKSSMWVLLDEINFLIKKVPAGRYAATYTSWATFNGYASGSAWLCRDEGATTFDIQPGQINLVSSRDAFPPGVISRISGGHSDEDILAQFDRTRKNYPALKGEPVLVAPQWETRWTPKEGFFEDTCNSLTDGSMTVMPIYVSAEDRVPDEAEQAAIAAALANMKKQSAAEGDAVPQSVITRAEDDK
tara:strand:+ start:31260 stop:32129 length:870 start_codon:yes stop_codon:yes gene_type:complete